MISVSDRNRWLSVARRTAKWTADRFGLHAMPPARWRRSIILLTCASLFLIAVGVRLLHWQDYRAELTRGEPWMADLVKQYKSEAQQMREGGGLLFPRAPIDPGDARLLLHPPGYSMLMAAIFWLWNDSNSAVRWVQIIGDGLAVVMVFIIAAELLNGAIALIAGLLAALSPHLAFYSLWLSPDSLAVLPILLAVYFLIKATKRPQFSTVIAAGAMIGVSCWLRANALMLAPFLALALAAFVVHGKRLRYGLTLIGATILVIAPITIRNAILFHRFIPLSIAGGENLVVGIGDLDKQGRFQMPTSDQDAALKDAEWHNRPDYAQNPWAPDGIERDQYRYARGLQVIRAHPVWFVGGMLRRAAFMLSYNDARSADWPFNTASVPIISAEPAVAHTVARPDDAPPIWSSAASGWLTDEAITAPAAEVSLAADSQSLRIVGDSSAFGDQLASAPLPIKSQTDYLLTLRIRAEQAAAAVKVTTVDRRFTLASAILDSPSAESAPSRKPKSERRKPAADEMVTEPEMSLLQMVFASGDRSAVRLVISNNGPTSGLHITQVGQADLFELGATPYLWTRYPRALAHGLQKNLFKTRGMLPLVIAGLLLLGMAGRGRVLVVLLVVPIYYLCVQSALSTEYRYILALHYCLFIASAVALYGAGITIGHLTFRLSARIRERRGKPASDEAERS